MNKTANFYEDQSDQTAAKIYFYDKYIFQYLIKILMVFGQCIVADLFCGCGKNGTKNGSPLTLLENIKNIVYNPTLLIRQKTPKVTVVFNDSDCQNISSLENEIKKFGKINALKIVKQTLDYKKIIAEVLKDKIFNTGIPKFYFLDPYTYTSVDVSELKSLMGQRNSEVLLFLPTFHAYRFISGEKPPEKLKKFVSDFCDRGLADYADISDFVSSIKQKLENEIENSFVRPLIIEAQHSKNTLFLITKNMTGAAIFNDLVWNTSGEKWGINLKRATERSKIKDQLKLQGIDADTVYDQELSNLILDSIKECDCISNCDIIELSVRNLFRLTHANVTLKKLIKVGKVLPKYLNEKTRRNSIYIGLKYRDDPKVIFSIPDKKAV